MIKTYRVVKQLALKAHTYTGKDGLPQTFYTMGFELTDGVNTLYAELQGASAAACPQLDTSRLYTVQAVMTCSSYLDKNGETRYENKVKIVKIAAL